MADPTPPRDLTALLLPTTHHDEAAIERAVLAGGYGDVWLRIQRLDAIALWQVELFDAMGMPRLDPALVMALSQPGQAAFVHVNHEARQAVVHAFKDGAQVNAWVGEPPDLDAKLRPAVGHDLAAITAADDGTRLGIGISSSHTVGLVRGRKLAIPRGMPTTLGTFAFHDAGRDLAAGDRVALCAVDVAALSRAWSGVPGAELAARVRALPDAALGPLRAVREEGASELAALGDQSPGAAGLRSAAALELLALGETYLHAGGEALTYLDARFLPMFSLSTGIPVFDDEDDDELDALPSVLAAMVEVLPYASPDGSMLEQVADAELSPFAPWAQPGEEYVGSILRLDDARLGPLLCEREPQDLALRVDEFYRAWWKDTNDEPLGGPEFLGWRRKLDDKGAADFDRFLRTWAEWRTVLTLARANSLAPALLFYG